MDGTPEEIMPRGVRTAQRHPSFIHIKITPTPELELEGGTAKLMTHLTAVCREQLGDSARVEGVATLNPKWRDFASDEDPEALEEELLASQPDTRNVNGVTGNSDDWDPEWPHCGPH